MTIRTRFEHRLTETDPDWEREYKIDVEYDEAVGQPHRRRACCTCGWRGRWRRGRTRVQDALSDCDDHANEVGHGTENP